MATKKKKKPKKGKKPKRRPELEGPIAVNGNGTETTPGIHRTGRGFHPRTAF